MTSLLAPALARLDEPGAPTLPREVLSFRLGAEEYGIDILTVQEIRSHEPPTRIAQAPGFLKGVMTLRGVIVPVVDLRERFGCASAAVDAFTVVIVLHLGARTVGVVVDSVSDVTELAPEAVKPAPPVASAVDAAFITGLATLGDRTLIVIDIRALLSSPDMGLSDVALH
jgi:purine-binding chemotaxis protein CheW